MYKKKCNAQKERGSSLARMTAENKALLHLFLLSSTTGALLKELREGVCAQCLDCCHT